MSTTIKPDVIVRTHNLRTQIDLIGAVLVSHSVTMYVLLSEGKYPPLSGWGPVFLLFALEISP